MKDYDMAFIISSIRNHFTDIYTNAAAFLDTPLFCQCMGVIADTANLNEIVSKNDQERPPVETLLKLCQKHNFHLQKISDFDSICMGELMAFIFKQILKYENQRDNVPVEENDFGIKTAALYFRR